MNISPPPIAFRLPTVPPAGFNFPLRPVAVPVPVVSVVGLDMPVPVASGPATCRRNWASAQPAVPSRLPKITEATLSGGPRLTSTERENIGAGVGGQVFRCKIDGQPFIVKSVEADQLPMLAKEVAAFRSLRPHANICAPLRVAVVDGKPSMIFATGTVPSSTVAERAASLPPNDQLAVLEVSIRDLLKGLDFLHRRGYAHGDIKTANSVYNVRTGEFQLIDLGHSTVASAADRRTGAQVLRQRCGRSGDPDYISPELRRPELGNKALDARFTLESIDVYAMGRIMQDALAHADERFEKVHGGKPSASMAAADPQVAQWVARRERLGKIADQMLRKDPGARPMVGAALAALTPESPAERRRGREVLAQLMGTRR